MKLLNHLIKHNVVTGPVPKNSSYSHSNKIKNDLLCIPSSDPEEKHFIFGKALHERFLEDKYESYALLSEEEKKRIEAMLKKMNSNSVVKRLMVNSVCEDKKYGELFGVEMSYILDIYQPAPRIGSDIKTTTAKTFIDCKNRALAYGYPKQSFVYKQMENLREFYFIFVDKFPPHSIYIISSNEFKEQEKAAAKELEFLLWWYKTFGELMSIEDYWVKQKEKGL